MSRIVINEYDLKRRHLDSWKCGFSSFLTQVPWAKKDHLLTFQKLNRIYEYEFIRERCESG